MSEISDSDLRDAVEAFARFAAAPTRGRGEPDDTVLSSWASAQALVALLKREHLVPDREVLASLLARVLALQDTGSGGWRLRFHGRVASDAAIPAELRLLSLAALRRAQAFESLSDDQLSARARLEDDISESCIDRDGGLRLEDRPAYGYGSRFGTPRSGVRCCTSHGAIAIRQWSESKRCCPMSW
jgi:hypothetical protein